MSDSTRAVLTQAAKAAEASDQADASVIDWYAKRATELEVRLALSIAITEWRKAVECGATHLALLERAVEVFGQKEAA